MTRVRVRPKVEQFAGPRGLPRLLRGDPAPAALDAHLAVHGALPLRSAEALQASVERAGLQGRGGAGFPTAVKLAAVASRRGPAVVVANGTEGEPASSKDQRLLQERPHLVLDGVGIAAVALRAREAIVAMDRTRPHVVAAVRAAVAQRDAAGANPVPVRVVVTPGRYVAGEESALVHWLNGGPAKPTTVPPRPFERGVGGRPTLVQNVETLAHVALIARYGSTWFRELGPASQPGSALVTVSGGVPHPGVREIELGTPISSLIERAPGVAGVVGAVLVGGYFGTWLTPAEADVACLSNESLRGFGASVGCGAIAVLPSDRCGVLETARVLHYLGQESAGQCGPCVNGVRAIADGFRTLAEGRAPTTIQADLERWTGSVAGRGACKLPDGVVRLLGGARRAFAAEIALHQRGRCSARNHDPVLPIPMADDRDWAWR